jgi:hypothetical protein
MNFINCNYKGDYKDNYRYSCFSKKTPDPLMVIINKKYDFGRSLDNRNMNFDCYTEYEEKGINFKYNCDPTTVITNEKYDFKNNLLNYGPEKKNILSEYIEKKEKKRKEIIAENLRQLKEQGYESDDNEVIYSIIT